MTTITVITQSNPWVYLIIPILCYILGTLNGYIVRGLTESKEKDSE